MRARDRLRAGDALATAEPDGLDPPRRHWALAGLWGGMAMSALDSAITNIALPSIARDLAVSPAQVTWVVTAYQIAIVMTLLPFAMLGERLGYLRVYLGGLVLFVLMSFGCARAGNLEVLASFRFAQGIAAAAMMSVNGALMRYTWPAGLFARGIGYNAVVVTCTTAAGPALAGLILSVGPWPWLFLVNVPAGLAALALVVACGPRILPVTRTFDGASAILSAVMFCALFLTASDVVQGAVAPKAAWTAIVGVGAGIWLIRRARGKARPFIPLDLVRIVRIRLAYGASICGFAAQTCLLVALPFELENRMGLPVAVIGLLFLPMPLTIALISPVAGRMADRSWAGLMSAAGLLLLALVLVLMAATLRLAPPPVFVALGMGLCGVGFGLFQVPNNNVMLRTGPLDRAGAAAGMQAQCRLIGQTGGALVAALSLRHAGLGPEGALAIAAALALAAAACARAR